MKLNFTSTVGGAALLLTIVGVVSKGLGFLREILFAGYFGLTADFDSYLIGAVLPITLNTIILYLGQNYIIPTGNRIKIADNELVNDFFTLNLYIFFFASAILGTILFLFSNWIIKAYLSGVKPETYQTTINIFRIYLCTVPLSGIISVLSAQYQMNFKFKYPAYSTILMNISFIILILLFTSSLHIYIIPIAYLAGTFIQVIYLLKNSDIKINFHFEKLALFKRYVPPVVLSIIFIESIGQLYQLSDRFFWKDLPEGGLAAINYAQNIFLLPISIVSVALSTALFPRLSELLSKKNINEVQYALSQGINISIYIFVPLTFLFITYGNQIIALLFERGRFTSSDSIITHQALIYYSLSLVFYAAYSVFNKMMYGLNLIKYLLFITIIGIVLKIVFNFILAPIMGQNGLALSTSLSYIYFSLITFYIIQRQIITIIPKNYIAQIIFYSLSSFLAYSIIKIMVNLFNLHYSTFTELSLFVSIIFLNIITVRHSSIKLLNKISDQLPFNFKSWNK